MLRQRKNPPGCKSILAVTTALAVGLLAGACASNTNISSTWHKSDSSKPRFERLVIVGVSDNTDSRMTFEDAVVFDLRSEDTKAWSSSRHMSPDEEIDEENLRTLVKEKQADAIIVTTVTSMDVKAVESGGRTDVMELQQEQGTGIVPQRKTGAVFRYDYNETVEPVYITSEYSTVLTTEVYTADTGEHIYTAVSTATKQETLAQVIDVLSDVIAARLRSDGVVR